MQRNERADNLAGERDSMRYDIRIGRMRRDRGFNVARPSVLGNPFKLGIDGDRAEVIDKYRVWLRSALKRDPRVRTAIEKLTFEAERRDVTLLCHCAPEACHAEVIADEIRRRISV
jgi:hypothetical protein